MKLRELISQNLWDNVGEALILIDLEKLVILDINNAAEALLKYQRDDLVGKDMEFLVSKDPSNEKVDPFSIEVIRQVGLYKELYLIIRDGTILYINLIVRHISMDDKVFALCILRDITNSMMLEREMITKHLALIDSLEELNKTTVSKYYVDNIVKSMIDSLIVVDPDGNIKTINKATSDLLGYKEEDIIGKPVANIFEEKGEGEGEDLSFKGSGLGDLIKKGSISNVEKNYLAKDGRKIPVLFSGSVMYEYADKHRLVTQINTDKEGESRITNHEPRIAGIVCVASDITERKKVEEALKAAKFKSEESDRLKSAFLATMSHEIRTPMNAVIGYTDLMLCEELSDKQRKYMQTIKDCGNLLLAIINDILDLSKIEAGQIEIERTRCSLESLLHNVGSNGQMLLSQKGKDIGLRHGFPDNISKFIVGDPTRLQQVMNNLMINAVKFTEKGYIEYGVSLKDKNTLEFYIRDTGIGIPKDKQDEIFEPFRQADISMTRRYGGTGLGLTITKRLVELMGGEIKLESRVGEEHGSTFYFTIPYETKGVQNLVRSAHPVRNSQ